ncbi:DDRGK domain-containing protein 1 isoform X1 [Lingula anatina]|uniref:DDRGK domain-containing protein 1 n=2 Tax=Lingula anatina TaxID=7574 RepID=A0A1S3IEC6_LINAN|nr:DDRGK domain-containing protein 1 isoform X1 [Lingula anatina]|eukprot:XP_013396211.1 DDRGK domain-containing protein 1 isoform X1 [Lingula anatina]
MDPLIYIAAAICVTLLLFFVTRFRKSSTKGEHGAVRPVAVPRAAPRARADMPAGAAARRRGRNRMAAARQRNDDSDYNEDMDEEDIFDQIAQPEGKVGAKKLRKLQDKAEKKSQREAEERERQERKEREQKLEELRKKEEEKRLAEEKIQEEEEKKRKEEEAQREHEEYLKMKEQFSVDEEGLEEMNFETNEESLLQSFVNYIKDMKVVMLEDLAAHFKIKTQDAVDRVKEMVESGQLTGVMDDRGKFIYITMDEIHSVAKFIKQRGRVSITELAECSNRLINLNPDNSKTFSKLVGDSKEEVQVES